MSIQINQIIEEQGTPLSIIGLEELCDENDINIQFGVYNCRLQRMSRFSIRRTELTPALLKCNIVQNGGSGTDFIKKFRQIQLPP